MEQLWAPWRMQYVEKPDSQGCFLCNALNSDDDQSSLVLLRQEQCFVIMNRFPYNSGHLMVVVNRHIGEIDMLTNDELLSAMQIVVKMKTALQNTFSPQGFNIGLNQGRASGAGLETHLHFHIVPRWNGDTNFMPVFADVKVVPEALFATYTKLLDEIKRLNCS